jgi:hypothetical protein
MKKISDLLQYKEILPYDSEIFGVYQPMIGWRSKRIRDRIDKGFHNDRTKAAETIFKRLKPDFEMKLDERGTLQSIGALGAAATKPNARAGTGSFVIESLARELPADVAEDDPVWDRLIDAGRIGNTLSQEVIPKVMEWHRSPPDVRSGDTRAGVATRSMDDANQQVAQQLQRESLVAGYLLHLKQNKQYGLLKQLFYKPDVRFQLLTKLLQFKDPLDYMDPFKDIERAGLSPIGIVHLFRQYFFEFDTFLGSPVGHVWLSPGGTVELMEVSTRKTLVERTTESTIETSVKTEKSLTEQDDLSDGVKEDNKSDTKFGANATANQSWIGGSATASASINMDQTQSKARETSHKHMRQQTEKISTEIRKNFKSTFRTVTETTDTSSKRYVLTNTTPDLLNYEMRRKMRQVGVQVQDIGTYLCWQSYVDDPGRQLGISKLVHLAKGPEMGDVPPPEAIPMPQVIVTDLNIDIPFVPKTEDTLPEDDMDEAYEYGREVNTDDNEGDVERVKYKFTGFKTMCGQPGYEYGKNGMIQFDYGGNDILLELGDVTEDTPGSIAFSVTVKHVNFRNVSPLRVLAKVTWQPSETLTTEVETQNLQKVKDFNEKTKLEHEKAFVEAARERINLMGRVEPRSFEDLREEERIVVYRSLVQDMLTKGLPMPDDRTRHVVSELLNTIFDIDKMLYFVAPEWWRPRLHQSHQGLGGIRKPSPLSPSGSGAGSGSGSGSGVSTTYAAASSIHAQMKSDAMKQVISTALHPIEDQQIAGMDQVGWGGAHENRVDNYYITEDSAPAKLGASLGWLLQLDGDNMRNAFLNAPWVKAVIPIRPGKERAAMNWLERLHIEGTDGLDDLYAAPPAELAEIPHSGANVTIRDAIHHLCDVVAEKHKKSMEVGRYPEDEINDDNRISSTPVDKVYEHGFYPLQGGFRATALEDDFKVFDQWIEVLPTDQIVPVPVAYDPKTGRQL